MKILKENISSKVMDIYCDNIFFWCISSGKGNKKHKQMALYQTKHFLSRKNFYTAKETIYEMKRQPTEQESIFANDTSDKGLIFKL